MSFLDSFGKDALQELEASPDQAFSSGKPLKKDHSVESSPDKDKKTHHLYASFPTHPWFRFWARCIDTIIFGIPIGFVIGFLVAFIEASFGVDMHWLFADNNKVLVSAIINIPLLCLVEALLLSTWGTTPGKWIFRIKLKNEKGIKPSFGEAIARSALVWWRGLAAGFPLVWFATLLHAYNVLRRDGITTWDRDLHLTVTHRSTVGVPSLISE